MSVTPSSTVAIDPDGMAVLARQVAKAQQDLQAAASTLRSALAALGLPTTASSNIASVASWLDAQVPGLQRRQVLAVAAASLDPWLTAPGRLVIIDEGLAMHFQTPADATAAGKAAAARLAASLGNTPLDAAAVAELQRFGKDPYYAKAFAEEMGPAGLAELAQRMQYLRDEVMRNSSMSENPAQELADFDRHALSLVTAVGNTFATAARGSGETALAPDFADQLLEGLPNNAFGLSQLLRFGDYGSEFLARIGNGVYEHERTNATVPGYWKQRAYDLYGPVLPRLEEGKDGYWDPLVGVMDAMGRNPVAAQEFLGDPEKLDYFAKDRRWSADEGDAFGLALEAATTHFRDHAQPTTPGGMSAGEKSALIASQAVSVIAASGHTYANMRDSLGNIMAEYIADVGTAAQRPAILPPGVDRIGDLSLPQPQHYGAVFNSKDLRDVMTSTFEDPAAFQVVSAAATAYATTYFNEMARQAALLPAQPGTNSMTNDQENLLKVSAVQSGALFGLVVNSGNFAGIIKAEGEDAKRQAMLDLANSGLDLIPLPGKGFIGELGGFAVGQVKDQVFTGLTPGAGGKARVDAGTADDVAKVMLDDIAAAAMQRHGLFGDGGPTPSRSHPEHFFADGGAQDFILPDGSIESWKDMSDAQQNAYIAWLKTSPAGFSAIHTAALTEYNNKMAEYSK